MPEKIPFLCIQIVSIQLGSPPSRCRRAAKEAGTPSRDTASCTSLHTTTRGNAAFKAGLNKLLCSALQGTRRVQPGAVSLKSRFKLHLKQPSGCIHRLTVQENRLGSQWHCAQSSQGIPPPTVLSCDSDLMTSEEGMSKAGMLLAASRKRLCLYSLKIVTLPAIPWKQNPSINFPQPPVAG